MSLSTFPTMLVVLTVLIVLLTMPLTRVTLPTVYPKKMRRLVALGFDESQLRATLVGMAIAIGLAIAYLAIDYGHVIVSVILVPIAIAGFGWGMGMAITRRERTLRNQLAQFSFAMSGAVKANMAPASAIAKSTVDAPAPLKPILARIVQDFERGAPLLTAIKQAEERIALDSFSLFSTAVSVTMNRGGRLDESLIRIANSICDAQRLEDKLEASTASSRNALLVMALFPFGFTLFFYQLDPSGYDSFTGTTKGQLAIGGMLALTYIAIRWGKAILDTVAN